MVLGAPLFGCADSGDASATAASATAAATRSGASDAGAARAAADVSTKATLAGSGWTEIVGVTAAEPGNTFRPDGAPGPWTYLRSVFAPAGLVDGRDYTIRQWQGNEAGWPGEFGFDWSFPDFHPGDGMFCWAYPALLYGAGPWGYHQGTTDNPTATRAGAFEALTIDVDFAFSGANGADILLDFYTLPSPDRFNGSHINEVSIFLSHDGVGPLSWLDGEATTTLALSDGLGDCAVYKQPTSSQVMVMPRNGGERRALLSGRVNVKEVFDRLIAAGLVDPQSWVTGFEIGVETQRPNRWNSAPFSGSLSFHSAPTVSWR